MTALPVPPSGLLLVLLAALLVALPFASRPVPPAVELRLQRALVLVCAGVLLVYGGAIIVAGVAA